MIQTLREFYGLQPTPPADLFQFFVWEILSEHALPARRDLAWLALRRIPALTPDAVFRVPAKELQEAVSLAGPHAEQRVEKIRGVVGEFKRHRDALSTGALSNMRVLNAARALRRLESVSAATRARALLFSAGQLLLPIDEEVNRVVGRLMGSPGNRRRGSSRRWLRERLTRNHATYRDAIVYLRHHAQHTCVAIAPHCGVCPLRSGCASVPAGA